MAARRKSKGRGWGRTLRNPTPPSGTATRGRSPELCLLPSPRALFAMHSRSGALYKTVICTEARGRGSETASPPTATRTCRDLPPVTLAHQLRGCKPECSPLGLAGSFSSALPETPASELPLTPTSLSPSALPPHSPSPAFCTPLLPPLRLEPRGLPRLWRICLKCPQFSISKNGVRALNWPSPAPPLLPVLS